jgi:hypothetical protein
MAKMPGTQRRNRIRRVFGVVVLAASIAVGVTTILTSTRASAAVGIPHKVCSSTQPDGVPEPGDTISCQVFILGGVSAGETIAIAPTAPSGAFVSGCMGVTGVTTPAITGGTGAGNACTLTAVPLTPAAGDVLIGTETVQIPSSTAANTSVTQTAAICEIAPVGCFPATPMGVGGGGSCVDGPAIPGIGGCQPAAPSSSPPTSPPTSGCLPSPLNSFCIPPSSPTPTCLPSPFNSFCIPPPSSPAGTCLPSPLNTFCIPPSGSPPATCLPIPGLPPPLGCPASGTPTPAGPGGSNGGGGGGSNGGGSGGTGQTQAGQVAGTTATSTPFTGGPPHPLPVLGLTIVGLGLLISGFTFWPGARRRLHIRLERTKNNW